MLELWQSLVKFVQPLQDFLLSLSPTFQYVLGSVLLVSFLFFFVWFFNVFNLRNVKVKEDEETSKVRQEISTSARLLQKIRPAREEVDESDLPTSLVVPPPLSPPLSPSPQISNEPTQKWATPTKPQLVSHFLSNSFTLTPSSPGMMTDLPAHVRTSLQSATSPQKHTPISSRKKKIETVHSSKITIPPSVPSSNNSFPSQTEPPSLQRHAIDSLRDATVTDRSTTSTTSTTSKTTTTEEEHQLMQDLDTLPKAEIIKLVKNLINEKEKYESDSESFVKSFFKTINKKNLRHAKNKQVLINKIEEKMGVPQNTCCCNYFTYPIFALVRCCCALLAAVTSPVTPSHLRFSRSSHTDLWADIGPGRINLCTFFVYEVDPFRTDIRTQIRM